MKRSRRQSQEAPSRRNWLDGAAAFDLPGPNPVDEGLAAHLAAGHVAALGLDLALDHHLRRDAGMVGAGLPQHVPAAHALQPAHDVLQGIVERMAHMQAAGDIGRRNDDRVGLGVGPSAAFEDAGIFPVGVDSFLDVLRTIGFVQHC